MLKKNIGKNQDFYKLYENLTDEKAERRDKKKMRKMPVHSAGLYEVWKMKIERVRKVNPLLNKTRGAKEKNDYHPSG